MGLFLFLRNLRAKCMPWDKSNKKAGLFWRAMNKEARLPVENPP